MCVCVCVCVCVYIYIYIYIHTVCVCVSLASRGAGGRWVNYPGAQPQKARKFLVYSLHNNAIGTKHIGGVPHQNYDPGLTLALDGPCVYYNINI